MDVTARRYCESMSPPEVSSLPEIIDHTLLKPETTRDECAQFVREAALLGVHRVCISPIFVDSVARRIDDEQLPLEIVTVVGFPSGTHETPVKVLEATRALRHGATEIDFVANLALIKASEWTDLAEEFRRLRDATAASVIKVILETACLTDDEIVRSCVIARETGLDFVKTSTGFNPAGGASVHAVRLMAGAVGGQLGVKASGGIRTAHAVRELLDAGATRLGISATAAVLAEWNGERSVENSSHPDSEY